MMVRRRKHRCVSLYHCKMPMRATRCARLFLSSISSELTELNSVMNRPHIRKWVWF